MCIKSKCLFMDSFLFYQLFVPYFSKICTVSHRHTLTYPHLSLLAMIPTLSCELITVSKQEKMLSNRSIQPFRQYQVAHILLSNGNIL